MRILTWNIHGARDASLAELAREIAAQQADVVCLNEVRHRHGKRIGALLGMGAHVASSFIGPYGNVVLTAQPVTAWRQLRFSDVRRVARRDAAIVTLATGTTVASIHFGLSAPERRRNTAELLEALPERSIVAGDTNETPDREVARMMSGRFDDAGRESGPTFPSSEPHARIDYIWVPSGTIVRDCRTTPTSASDHLPVVADLG